MALTYGTTSNIDWDVSPTGRDDAGSLSIQGITAPENADKLIAGLREEYSRLVRDGVTAEELADASATCSPNVGRDAAKTPTSPDRWPATSTSAARCSGGSTPMPKSRH